MFGIGKCGGKSFLRAQTSQHLLRILSGEQVVLGQVGRDRRGKINRLARGCRVLVPERDIVSRTGEGNAQALPINPLPIIATRVMLSASKCLDVAVDANRLAGNVGPGVRDKKRYHGADIMGAGLRRSETRSRYVFSIAP